MATAAKVLASIAKNDPRHLPRYRSGRSGDVFARLTSPQNLARFRDRSLPIKTRMEEMIAFMPAASLVNKIYLAAFLGKATGDSELVEVTGAVLRMMALLG